MINVAWCEDCSCPIKAGFQINLKNRQIDYFAPYPVRHDGHDITFTKTGSMTWT